VIEFFSTLLGTGFMVFLFWAGVEISLVRPSWWLLDYTCMASLIFSTIGICRLAWMAVKFCIGEE